MHRIYTEGDSDTNRTLVFEAYYDSADDFAKLTALVGLSALTPCPEQVCQAKMEKSVSGNFYCRVPGLTSADAALLMGWFMVNENLLVERWKSSAKTFDMLRALAMGEAITMPLRKF